VKALLRRFLAGRHDRPPIANQGVAHYPAWLARRLDERAVARRVQAPPNFLSILTCVYRGSPAGFFRETVASVLSQRQSEFEWVLLANGPLDGDMEPLLSELAIDARVHLLSAPENVGIIQGLRLCLEAATGDYVLPLDGDDLLTSDAVSVIVEAALDAGCPEFLYGDEDVWVDGQPAAPYFRADWDPLLNLSSSYIWHPSVFRTQTALELGVFSDTRSEYCQDWDTVFRFVDAGAAPVHIPEVLYHWRAHSASSTNRPDRHQGSLRSQRHVLERHLERLGLAERYGLAEFPLDRGLPEWWIESMTRDAPRMDVIIIVGDGTHRLHVADLPYAMLRECANTQGVAGLQAALDDCQTDSVVVIDGGLGTEASVWASEASSILDLIPDVGFVGGRIIDEMGVVLTGEILIAPDGNTACPDRGRLAGEAGYYAVSLKPHLADGVTGRFFVAHRRRLEKALHELPAQATLPFLGAWLGAWAARAGCRVAYSPLLIARWDSSRDDVAETASRDERRAFADFVHETRGLSRWEWRKRCAELGEGRVFEDSR
jgi:Glycosyl transferase family 2